MYYKYILYIYIYIIYVYVYIFIRKYSHIYIYRKYRNIFPFHKPQIIQAHKITCPNFKSFESSMQILRHKVKNSNAISVMELRKMHGNRSTSVSCEEILNCLSLN